jgi:hypothetical protein
MCVFLINENLISKYEQLLILMDIDDSTLPSVSHEGLEWWSQRQ